MSPYLLGWWLKEPVIIESKEKVSLFALVKTWWQNGRSITKMTKEERWLWHETELQMEQTDINYMNATMLRILFPILLANNGGVEHIRLLRKGFVGEYVPLNNKPYLPKK
jgi:hypothetical protein